VSIVQIIGFIWGWEIENDWLVLGSWRFVCCHSYVIHLVWWLLN